MLKPYLRQGDNSQTNLNLKEERLSFEYEVEGHKLTITEQVCKRMEQLGMSRKELAEKMQASPAYITKVLRGSPNITIETMVKFARALRMVLKLDLI